MTDEPLMTEADLLGQRVLLELTQAQMADKIGVSLRYYIEYEKGRAPIPRKVKNAVTAIVLTKASTKVKTDGRHRKPVDWSALGKVAYVYQGPRCTEQGHNPMLHKDPSGRARFKTEAELREWHKPWRIEAVEERANGWHIAINGATIPPE